MLTKAVYGAVARSAGRAAARRQLAGGGIRWRYGRSKRLSARQVDIILAYIRSLPDYDKPGYYVDGVRREP